MGFAQNAQMYRNLQFSATLFLHFDLSHKMRTNHDSDQRKPILERRMIAGLDGTRSYTVIFWLKNCIFPEFSYFWQIFAIFWHFYGKIL